MPDKQPIFLKSVIILIACSLFFLYAALRTSVQRAACEKNSGIITYIGNQFGRFPESPKDRFIQLNGKAPVYKIFIGKSKTDIKPRFEQLDKLKTGDTIIIFFDESLFSTKDPYVNYSTTFIDKNGEVYYEKGNMQRPLAIGMMIVCLLATAGTYLLKRLGKIR
ncbi:hypothetical protein [Chitinophaga rhizosphaerae]|uniref:hypothetical protein n=1 Tax=Chitinophaga rhizosphaerae TaxID=1864947 RepID=UPI000F80571D|nr:hypothetical protein [Chitinophaga rhizosphaerae]